MTRLDIVNVWKLIRKFQKWLYNLHTNPIATRRNVISDLQAHNENTLSSYSILNLKTLFKFVSQCNLVPFLESGLCNDRNELDNCDFAIV